jgi:hypothetical protein
VNVINKMAGSRQEEVFQLWSLGVGITTLHQKAVQRADFEINDAESLGSASKALVKPADNVDRRMNKNILVVT